MSKTYSVFVAGSTHNTTTCAQALVNSEMFKITGVLTPIPKPIGRAQLVMPNPLDQFAQKHKIPTVYLEKNITESVATELQSLPKPDILLVVDFGYMIPDWMLAWPTIAPVNIHPSLVPRWRGSSPGQFVLLYNELETGCSVLVMTSGLDSGPIITQLRFKLEAEWTQKEYYAHAFALVSQQLPKILAEFAHSPQKTTPQPEDSPTPIASRLSKETGFVPWSIIQVALSGQSTTLTELKQLSPILQHAFTAHNSLPQLLDCACRAFYPWPGIWTMLPTRTGIKRLKIHETSVADGKLYLHLVQLEGKTTTTWDELKNVIQE